MFLPTTMAEVRARGWDRLDVILVSGDTCIDHYFDGASLIGHFLIGEGYRVGIICQPDISSPDDITRLGEPLLFWGVTAGSVDSMVSNYTSLKKKRNKDDLTPGVRNDRRPDRACIAYSNLIRRHFKGTAPIVIGGIEASLRRVTHFDYWSGTLRRPVLFDARADVLVYGMGERAVLELAKLLKSRKDFTRVRGICFISRDRPPDAVEIPSFEVCVTDKNRFSAMFRAFYGSSDPVTGKRLCQKVGDRYLVHNPPALSLTEAELDAVYEMDFEREVHPYYRGQGEVRAMDTIRFSVTTHRGCYGECNFCAIALHQGRGIASRSEDSIVKEIRALTLDPRFRGTVTDVGGPTANMYRIDCVRKQRSGACRNRRCLYPEICPELPVDHERQLSLLKRVRAIGGIKNAFVASGIRYDLVMADKARGDAYLEDVVTRHTSGQMKVAPEHTEPEILRLMGKPGNAVFLRFLELFRKINGRLKKKKYLTYYFIAAHPGCRDREMERLAGFARKVLKMAPEQVQVFTPTPSTISTFMYYTGEDYETGNPVFVERDTGKKERQKKILTGGGNRRHKRSPSGSGPGKGPDGPADQ